MGGLPPGRHVDHNGRNIVKMYGCDRHTHALPNN
jgi:hypothetical protein